MVSLGCSSEAQWSHSTRVVQIAGGGARRRQDWEGVIRWGGKRGEPSRAALRFSNYYQAVLDRIDALHAERDARSLVADFRIVGRSDQGYRVAGSGDIHCQRLQCRIRAQRGLDTGGQGGLGE